MPRLERPNMLEEEKRANYKERMQDIFRYYHDQNAAAPEDALWLYGDAAHAGAAYQPLQEKAASLAGNGRTVFSMPQQVTGAFDSVYLAAPRQREESEGLIALALRHARRRVVVAASNDAGGRRLQAMLAAYGVPVSHLSKYHSQLVWTEKPENADPSRIAENLAHLIPREIAMEGESYWTLPGLFGWDRIDPGSRLLIETLPTDLQGEVADFGCGYGYLTAQLARRFPAIRQIDAFDADARAVECARLNMPEKTHCHWQDIRTLPETRRYDAVVMNPPFHSGKEERIGLGQSFIEKAWSCLRPGGRLFLVANRHLPYEKIVPEMAILRESNGYKIMGARRS